MEQKTTSFNAFLSRPFLSLSPMGWSQCFSSTAGGFVVSIIVFFATWTGSFRRTPQRGFAWFPTCVCALPIAGTGSFMWEIVHSYRMWPCPSFTPCTFSILAVGFGCSSPWYWIDMYIKSLAYILLTSTLFGTVLEDWLKRELFREGLVLLSWFIYIGILLTRKGK